MKNETVYQKVTDRIIEQLEKGVIPWRKGWTGVRGGAYSRSTGRAYSLVNQMLLPEPGEYLTFKQCTEAGGKIRKGEKSSVIVFWKVLGTTKVDEETGEITQKNFPMLKYFNVFHISQCEGIEPKWKQEDLKPFDPIAEAEEIAANYSKREDMPIINEAQNRAYYSPTFDKVVLPLREQFNQPAEYYSTMFHELTHSTGHFTRLSRFECNAAPAAFGSENYGKEELVAEIGAAQIMASCGFETEKSFKNSTSYIANWLHAIKGNPRLVVSAASKAEKAANLILGIAQPERA